MPTCKWCGKEYTKKYNAQQYCSENCKHEGYLDKTRVRVRKYRRTHKEVLGEKQKYGLGSWGARLGPHPCNDFEEERLLVYSALKTLKLR